MKARKIGRTRIDPDKGEDKGVLFAREIRKIKHETFYRKAAKGTKVEQKRFYTEVAEERQRAD